MTTSVVTDADRALLREARAFATPSTVIGVWQLLSTLALLGTVTAAGVVVGERWAWALSPLWALVAVRVFVLQHDAGHRALVRAKAFNDWLGRALAVVTGVAHDGWRLEHDWHHQVTGRLDRRGIDLFNSPMTVAEAHTDPVRAQRFQDKVTPLNIAWLGMLALLVDRKRLAGFFIARPGFVWRINDGAVRPGLWMNNALHLGLHVVYIAACGPWVWLTMLLPGHVFAGMIGATLFWVQHNFESSVVDDVPGWRFVAAAVDGSSYLRLPWPLSYFTAHIGLHHVHHVSASIPNYRLEEARRSIPALAAIAPLTAAQLRSAYTHHFWDERARRRRSFADTFGATVGDDAASGGADGG